IRSLSCGETNACRERPSAISVTASASSSYNSTLGRGWQKFRKPAKVRRVYSEPEKCRRGSMPNYYPIMLDVRRRPALVIGGDRVAAEKAAALSASGAVVTALNPGFCE